MHRFDEVFGVFVCHHVFNRTKPVLMSVRDHDGDWQFLCGQDGCVEESEPKYIGIGHLIETDNTLNQLTALEPGTFAERYDTVSDWEIGCLCE